MDLVNEASLHPHLRYLALEEEVGQVGEEEGEVALQECCSPQNAVPLGEVEGVEVGE